MSTTIPPPAQPRVVPNAFHAGASPFPVTMLPARERSLDTLAYLVTRRVLAFSIIATVLLCLSLQSSTGTATWWSEGTTYSFVNDGFTYISLLQADLYTVGYSVPAPISTLDVPATGAGAALGFTSYSSWWVGQGVSL